MSVGFKASNHGRPLVGKLDCTEWAILLKSLVPLAKREKDSLRACEILRNTQYFFEQEHTQELNSQAASNAIKLSLTWHT